MNTLKAEKRTMDTKAKKLRREGYVTGNVFGKEIEGSIPVKMTKKDTDRLLKTSGKGSQIMLDVDGQMYDVLIKEVAYNPIKGQVDELDFQALVKGEKVHSVAEVFLLNHEKTEGLVQLLLREIAYKAAPEALVDRVEIDMSKLRVGDSVRVKDLEMASHPGIELQTDPEAVVVEVTELRSQPAEDEAEGENGGE